MCYCFRSLNEHGLESSESFRFPMFDWFKSFMESAVSFGDGAKEGVEVMFKYFSCLKGKFISVHGVCLFTREFWQ